MMGSEEVARLAALARVELTPEELSALGRDLESVLGYVAELEQAPVAATNDLPVYRPLNVMRADEPLNQSATDGGTPLKVKKIL